MERSFLQLSSASVQRKRSLGKSEIQQLNFIRQCSLWRGYRLDKRESIYKNTYLKISNHPHILLRMANCMSTSELHRWGIPDETIRSWQDRKKYNSDKGICIYKYPGAGSTCSVKLIEAYNLTGEYSCLLAAKKIELADDQRLQDRKIAKVIREAELQHRAGEQLALPVYYVLKSENHKGCAQVIIVMGLSEGITGDKFFRDSPLSDNKLPKSERKQLALKFLDAYERLHRIPIFHRDIKLENMTIGNGIGGIDVKFLDYGIATDQEEDQCDYKSISVYSPPELLGAIARSARIDHFCAGVVLYNIIGDRREFTLVDTPDGGSVGYHEFTKRTIHKMEPVLQDIIANYHFKPDGMMALLKRMISINPGDRPAAMDEICRPFYRWNDQYSEWT